MTIELTDNEAHDLRVLIDTAVRARGAEVAAVALHLLAKLQPPREQPPAPTED